jgi:hypothetical protein
LFRNSGCMVFTINNWAFYKYCKQHNGITLIMFPLCHCLKGINCKELNQNRLYCIEPYFNLNSKLNFQHFLLSSGMSP